MAAEARARSGTAHTQAGGQAGRGSCSERAREMGDPEKCAARPSRELTAAPARQPWPRGGSGPCTWHLVLTLGLCQAPY